MKIKKSFLLFLLGSVSFVYVSLCIYSFTLISHAKSKVDTFLEGRGLSPDKIDILKQLSKSDCICQNANTKTKTPTHSNTNEITIRAVTLNRQMCDLTDGEINKHHADIQVSDLYSQLKLQFHRLTFNNRGWIPDFGDMTYSASQWDQEPLNVFIVPISHQDPGWLRTYWQYFNSKTDITLSGAVRALQEDPDVTFTWSEVIYLQMWYIKQHKGIQNIFKKQLESGRFEIITGGWVMTDEAVVHYSAMLDQLIEGHQWLKNTLNYTVRSAWSLDAFGVSPTMPYLLRRTGVQNLVVQRVHYAIKHALAEKKQLEFYWRQAWDGGSSTDVFTHVPPFLLYNTLHSCGPDPDVCCQFDFTQDNCYESFGKKKTPPRITDDNVHEKSVLLLDQLRKKAQFSSHHNLLMFYGDDFRYYKYSEWGAVRNDLRKLMDYMNGRTDMHVKLKLSTLSDYFAATHNSLAAHNAEGRARTPSLSGDFLSYTDRDDQYWAGYYTSRPFLKHMIRVLGQRMRVADILFSLVLAHGRHGNDQMQSDLDSIHQVSALLQHHDAITGTCRKDVVTDYLKRLRDALSLAGDLASTCVSYLLNRNVGNPDDVKTGTFIKMDYQENERSHLKQRKLPQDENLVAVFNPLMTQRESYITVTVSQPYVSVYDVDDDPVSCQVSPLWEGQGHEISQNKFKVTFKTNLMPLEVTTFKVKVNEKVTPHSCSLAKVKVISPFHHHDNRSVFVVEWAGMSDFVLESPTLQAYFCGCTGLLQGVVTRDNTVYHRSEVTFVQYGTGSWTNPLEDKSGAYTFVPNGPARDIEIDHPDIYITEGPLVSEVRTILPMVTHTASLYNSTGPLGSAVHFQNAVDISAHNNTELAIRVTTDVNGRDGFYTDVNGFQIHRRSRLPQYGIQGNYYPVTSQLYIEDTLFRLSLHTTASHGATSLAAGELEMMLDRRLAQDDWRGLSQGVLDNVPGTVSVMALLWETRHSPGKVKPITSIGHASLLSHQISLQLNNPPQTFLYMTSSQLPTMPQPYRPATSLPCDVHLMNLRVVVVWPGSANREAERRSLMVLHRVGVDCDFVTVYSEDCAILEGELSLQSLFTDLTLKSVKEVTVTGIDTDVSSFQPLGSLVILPVMEIKTFKLQLTETS